MSLFISFITLELRSTPQKFKCPECDAVLSTKGNLNQHKQVHNPDRIRYYCHNCPQSFVKQSGVKEHVKRVHKGVPYSIQYFCIKCGKGFTKKFNLNRHKEGCSGPKKSVCPEKSVKNKQVRQGARRSARLRQKASRDNPLRIVQREEADKKPHCPTSNYLAKAQIIIPILQQTRLSHESAPPPPFTGLPPFSPPATLPEVPTHQQQQLPLDWILLPKQSPDSCDLLNYESGFNTSPTPLEN